MDIAQLREIANRMVDRNKIGEASAEGKLNTVLAMMVEMADDLDQTKGQVMQILSAAGQKLDKMERLTVPKIVEHIKRLESVTGIAGGTAAPAAGNASTRSSVRAPEPGQPMNEDEAAAFIMAGVTDETGMGVGGPVGGPAGAPAGGPVEASATGSDLESEPQQVPPPKKQRAANGQQAPKA